MEIWKPVIGHEDKYEVSNLGNVRSIDRTVEQVSCQGTPCTRRLKGKQLKPKTTQFGYYSVNLYTVSSGRSDTFIHRIVAEAFIPNPEGKTQVNHINGIKKDNRIENLEWVTPSENVQHSYSIGIHKVSTGENHGLTKISEEDVRFIRENFKKRDPIYGATGLGKRFGVCPQTVLNIVNQKTWQYN